MSIIGVKKKIETVKSFGFRVSYVDFEGCLLDNHSKSLRCVIRRDRDFIEFKKYYDLHDGRRVVSRNSVPYHFLLEKGVDPIEVILQNIERTYENYTRNN